MGFVLQDLESSDALLARMNDIQSRLTKARAAEEKKMQAEKERETAEQQAVVIAEQTKQAALEAELKAAKEKIAQLTGVTVEAQVQAPLAQSPSTPVQRESLDFFTSFSACISKNNFRTFRTSRHPVTSSTF